MGIDFGVMKYLTITQMMNDGQDMFAIEASESFSPCDQFCSDWFHHTYCDYGNCELIGSTCEENG